jgi:superoxide reductase
MPTKVNEVYYCKVCGNEVQITHAGSGALFCCGQKMEKL